MLRIKKAGKMEEKDREIWIGENRLYFGEDDIIYITIVGEIDDKKASEIKMAILEFNRSFGKKIRKSLTDITMARKVSYKARRIFKELSEDDEIGGGKGAIFGLHPVARVLASFFIGGPKNQDQRFFKSKKEALAWLKE
jgi:hypothetical protein